MSSAETGIKLYLSTILKNKSGIVGVAMIILFIALSIYGMAAYKNVASEWNNANYWRTYPKVAMPAWMIYFNPNKIFSTKTFISQPKTLYSSSSYEVVQVNYKFKWNKGSAPSDVVFYVGTSSPIETINIVWKKPDGTQVTLSQSSPSEATDLLSYTSSLDSYISSQIGYVPPRVVASTLSKALFGYEGKGLLNGTVEKGTYEAKITLVVPPHTKVVANKLYLEGNAYGIFGTDIYGRPLGIGILLGLPNALEIGFLTSIISVIGGVIIGGISGYLGGKTDSAINWVTLVMLSLPILPFLVVMSYVMRPTLLMEALFISFLVWSFYAIIARSSAQSIRKEVYVEADKVLGIPSYRTFFTHFMPRLTPFAIAYTALGVPAGIILVETLAFLGLAPPGLITWGAILNGAEQNFAAVNGWWWWILFPGLMIILVSIPFVIIGFSIERGIFGGR